MKRFKSIQIKAALLLVIFFLNTVVSIACVCGIGLNKNSHHKEEDKKVAPGNLHSGCKAKRITANENSNPKEQKGKCCKDQVIDYNKADKSFEHSFNPGINANFFTLLISSFYNIDEFYKNYINTSIRYFVRSYHPPIPDIRIAIQSFQI